MKTNGNILLVNNDITDLSITSLLLTLSGYNVFSAKNNNIAEHYLLNNCPDLIICDLPINNFTEMNFINYLKEHSINNAPILVTSSISNKNETNIKEQFNLLDFFPKPFVFEDLLARIKSIKTIS